ncbi:hypothetical protein RHMOL_Rhmol07G0017000 [Rhododendron molle]|uniref:Uncharacterized protein n=1 Tax=Rhododendron molle TaxID=49168 RepID=A0ACC0MVS2_RHOML|nr:hypothetical protein RHMOL_Rhmol07G0017000 [Rhododendron molle]
MASSSETIEESPPRPVQVVEDKMYVVVGKDIKKNESVVTWALQNSGGRNICLLHVDEPAQRILRMGTKFPTSQLKKHHNWLYRDVKRQEMNKLQQDYSTMCSCAGVHVDVLHIEMAYIGKGIVELINQHGIRNLVMGAAAEKHYSKKMMEPKSKKAIYVHEQAPTFCHIWFICKGHLVHTREGTSDGVSMEVASSTLQVSPNTETRQSSSLRSQSLAEGTYDPLKLTSSGPNFHRGVWSILRGITGMRVSTFSLPSSVLEGHTNDELYDRLKQSMEEAFDESTRRREAEKDAIDAIHRVNFLLLCNKEVEEALAIALEHKSSLESQIANSELKVKDLEQKMFSNVQLLQNYKQERNELQIERNNAIKEAKELRKEQAEVAAANALAPKFFSEFSYSEIVEATSNFAWQIGEGGYGNVYRGLLLHTQVAIKKLHSNSKQGLSEFQQEVHVLSKLRHPNLVTLVGACPESFILVYEYLPNGSLEDRLCCKDKSPPLSWKKRIRIATELCSALIYLHSCNPSSIVHGDLKPANILLDSNYVSKLSDFGICRILNQNEFSSNNTAVCWITSPRGTFTYIDPSFVATGELTPKSDVYSFGIVLLRLLTGRPSLGIAEEVKGALDKGDFKNLLDGTAGDWPFEESRQLAHIAMRCCVLNRHNRPDLGCSKE